MRWQGACGNVLLLGKAVFPVNLELKSLESSFSFAVYFLNKRDVKGKVEQVIIITLYLLEW